MISKIGLLTHFNLIGLLFNVVFYILIIFFFQIDEPYLNLIPLTIYEIGFSFVSFYINSSLAFLVPSKYLGQIMSLQQIFLNGGQLVGSLIFGLVRDLTLDYMGGYLFNFLLGILINVLLAFLVIYNILKSKKKIRGFSSKF